MSGPASTLTATTRWLVWVAAVLGVAAIGSVDFVSGVELRVFPLYYLPIALSAWFFGRPGALITVALCTAAWLASNIMAGLQFSHEGIWVANAIMQAVSFAVTGLLIAALRSGLAREQQLSRADSLTALLNGRAFYEEAARVVALCRRKERPVTVAYIDLDNFKSVNDRLGHQAGDALLRRVADLLRVSIRPSDVCARLGGDEFVVLLPEVGRQEGAVALERLRGLLATALAGHAPSVTASIGAVTFVTMPASLEEIVHASDLLMYGAKQAGKNRVHLEVVGS